MADVGKKLVKYTSYNHPGRELYACHKRELYWLKTMRDAEKEVKKGKATYQNKLLCKVCHSRITHTIICEKCFDKIEDLKIKWQADGKDCEETAQDWLGGNK